MDVLRWKQETHISSNLGFFATLSYLLLWNKEFRNLFYRRLGTAGKMFAILFPGEKTLFLPHQKLEAHSLLDMVILLL